MARTEENVVATIHSLSPELLLFYRRAALATTNIGRYPAHTRGLFDIGHRDRFENELLQSPGPLCAWKP